MPQKNRRFPFAENSYYHIYNRGNNKSEIFLDEKDYWIYRRMLREQIVELEPMIELSCFCLLPNHFHLLLFQRSNRSISQLMKSVSVRYSMYMRKKYDRDGSLYSGGYRAVILPNNRALEQTKAYILKNPINAGYLVWKHVGVKI